MKIFTQLTKILFLLFVLQGLTNLEAKSQPCVAGFYDNGGICTVCPAGSYCPGDGSAYLCAAGSSQALEGQIECTLCPAGRFSEITGATECQACEAGEFSANVGATACSSCPAGTFQNITGASFCLSCPAGTAQGQVGSVNCVPCAAGTFSAVDGAAECQACAVATFQPNQGSTECLACSVCEEGSTASAPCTSTSDVVCSPECALLVNNTDQGLAYCSLQEAIDNAANNELITMGIGILDESADASGSGTRLSAGNSPGCITLTGNLILDNSNTFVAELDGNTVCTEYDQVQVDGTATLGGAALDVQLGYAPANGDVFTIVTSDNPIVGTFAENTCYVTSFAGDDYYFSISYSGNAVTLTAGDGPIALNTNTGNAYCTIQVAIDDASNGDVISVSAGTYDEVLLINKQITLLGPNATISAVNGIRVPEARLLQRININEVQNVTVSGFEFFEVPTTTTWTIYIQGNSDNFTFDNNRFIDITSDAIRSGISSSTGNIRVTGNLIEGITNPLATGILLGGIYGTSVISDNKIDLAYNGSPSGYSGIQTPSASGLTISGNEISNTTNQGIQLAGTCGNVVIENNHIFDTNTSGGADKGAIRLYGTDFNGPINVTGNILTNSLNGVAVKNGEDISGKDIVVENNDLSGNSNAAIYNGASAGELSANCNWYGSLDLVVIASAIIGDVDFIPYLVDSDINNPDCSGTPPIANLTQGTLYMTIQAAVDAANAGDVVEIQVADFTEPSQVVIDKNLTLQGQGKAVTTLRPGVNTGSAGDARGFILVNAGVNFTLQNLTMDGTGKLVWQALRQRGEGIVDNVRFTQIKFEETGPSYNGTAIAAFGTGNVNVSNSDFDNIGRAGVIFFGTGINGSLFTGNTYTGKGIGDWLDYALDISAGAKVIVSNNAITGNRGVASADGSTSGGILVTTFFGAGTEADITGNSISDNTIGVNIGVDGSDGSVVTVNGNSIIGNDFAIISTAPPVDATCNWYGTTDAVDIGNGITGNVTYLPLLLDGSETNPGATGFDPAGDCGTPSYASFTLSPSATNVAECDEFTILISVETSGPVNFADARYTFDPAALEVIEITAPGGGSLPTPPLDFNTFGPPVFDNIQGTFGYASGIAGSSQPDMGFDYFEVRFKALGNSGTTQISPVLTGSNSCLIATSGFENGIAVSINVLEGANTGDVTLSPDMTAPMVSGCPVDITQVNDPGTCGASVFWTPPTATDACGIASMFSTHNPGDFFPVGDTEVTYTFIDLNGLGSECVFTITVTDNEAPAIICPPTILVSADSNCEATLTGLSDAFLLNTSPCYNPSQAPTSISAPAPGVTSPNVQTFNTYVLVTDVLEGATYVSTASGGNLLTVTQGAPNGPVVALGRGTLNAGGGASWTAAVAGDYYIHMHRYDVPCGNTFGQVLSVTALEPGEVILGTVSVTDNCSSITVSNDAPGSFPLGSTTVTWTVTDVSGVSTTCEQIVMVEDTDSPEITTCAPDVSVDANASCEAVLADYTGLVSAEDNCDNDLAITQTPVAGSTLVAGPNLVTIQATDDAGNFAECTFIVTVTDNLAPTALCQNVTVQLDSNGDGTLLASALDNGSDDNCSFDIGVLGCPGDLAYDQNVTSEVIFGSGNANGAFTVGNGSNVELGLRAKVRFPSPANTFNSNSDGSYSHLAGSFGGDNLQSGWNFEWSINTDQTGSSGQSLNELTYQLGLDFDPTDGVDYQVFDPINLPYADHAIGDNSTGNGGGSVAADPAGYAALIAANNLAQNSWRPNFFGSFDGNVDGRYDVYLKAYDSNGNVVAQTAIAVIVGTGTGNAYAGCLMPLDSKDYDCSEVGANTETLVVIDASGNSSTCTSNVTVEDNIAPVASCQNVTVQLDASGSASITAASIDNGSSDACGIASIVASQENFDCSHVGSNTVSLTVTDTNNNTSTCTATVTVEDNVAPAALCQNVTVQLDASGAASIAAASIDNGSSDACGIASIVASQENFDCSHVGPNTVTLTVTDNNNNTATCTATVTVEDNVAPTAICQDVTLQLDATGNASIVTADVNGGSTDACGIDNVCLRTSLAGASNQVVTGTLDVGGTTFEYFNDNRPEEACFEDPNFGCCGLGAGVHPYVTDIVTITEAGVYTFTLTDINENVDFAGAIYSAPLNPADICENLVANDDDSNDAGVLDPEIVISVTLVPGTYYLTTFTYSANDDFPAPYSWNITLTDCVPEVFYTCADVGVNTVDLIVTDVNGNSSLCTANVTVEDNITPSITCASDGERFVTEAGSYSVSGTEFDPISAADNCSGSLTVSHNGESLFGDQSLSDNTLAGWSIPVGVHVVTFTASDGFNATACDVTIEVKALSLSGNVTMNLNCTPIPIRIELYEAGTPNTSPVLVETYTSQVDVNGDFSVDLAGLAPGTYGVYIKVDTYLQQFMGDNLIDGATSGINLTSLVPGDIAGVAFGDNLVGGVDLSLLVSAYNSQTGDPAYNSRADLDCNGQVDGLDLSLLIFFYNQLGDSPQN